MEWFVIQKLKLGFSFLFFKKNVYYIKILQVVFDNFDVNDYMECSFDLGLQYKIV